MHRVVLPVPVAADDKEILGHILLKPGADLAAHGRLFAKDALSLLKGQLAQVPLPLPAIVALRVVIVLLPVASYLAQQLHGPRQTEHPLPMITRQLDAVGTRLFAVVIYIIAGK